MSASLRRILPAERSCFRRSILAGPKIVALLTAKRVECFRRTVVFYYPGRILRAARTDDLDEVHRGMRITNLKDRREIEHAAVTRTINTVLTMAPEREAAIERREAPRTELSEINEELRIIIPIREEL